MEKLSVALTPTPLQYLENISRELGINLWIKRDDLTGDILTGGNKIRKLEYILADALNKGADTIITSGGLQSNHAKTTSALAIKLGLKPILLLNGIEPKVKKANMFINDILGVDIRYIDAKNQKEMNNVLEMVATELKEEGKNPYVIPVGGSNGLGSLGYFDAYKELEVQKREKNLNFQWEFITTGSAGTFSGIYMGHKILKSESKLIGVSPWLPEEEIKEQIIDCIQEGFRLIDFDQNRMDPSNLHIEDKFIGDGYGIPTKEGIRALKRIASSESILLDHVYTAKTMACLIHYVEAGLIAPNDSVLFWHTGGSSGLFAIEEQWNILNKDF
jgi:D-cysteine desulfhydrase family pyridoxal phosphate-dependent enzyme